MGKRTSVYLSDELSERVKASGLPLAELISRGLESPAPVLRTAMADAYREIAVPPGQYMGGIARQADGSDAVPFAHSPGLLLPEFDPVLPRRKTRVADRVADVAPLRVDPVAAQVPAVVVHDSAERRTPAPRPQAPRSNRSREACPHPKSRIIRGLCGACGTGGLG